MLDTVEEVRSVDVMAGFELPGGDSAPLSTRALVPMLDWPTDLFNTFTAEMDDDCE